MYLCHTRFWPWPSPKINDVKLLHILHALHLICISGDGKENYYVDFEDQVARGSCVLHNGEMMWPPPKIADPSPPPRPKAVEAAQVAEPNYFQNTLTDASMYTAGLGGMVGEWTNGFDPPLVGSCEHPVVTHTRAHLCLYM